MIEIYERADDEFQMVGQIVDGVYDGDESLNYIEGWDKERILQSLDGPDLVATEESVEKSGPIFKNPLVKDGWEPYIGPQGGEGWRHSESGEVVYQAQPPGGLQMPDEFPGELLDIGDGEEFESVINMPEGQPVLASDGDGEIILDEMGNIPPEGFVYGAVELDDDAQEELGIEDEPTQEDFIDEMEEAAQDEQEELSTGDWNQVSTVDLEDVPEGTEVSFETDDETITGEYGGVSGDIIEEYEIGDSVITLGDLIEPGAELYVNEESKPDDVDEDWGELLDEQEEFVDEQQESDEEEPGEPEDGIQVSNESKTFPKQHEYEHSGTDMAIEAAKVWELEETDFSFNPDEIELADIDSELQSNMVFVTEYSDLDDDDTLADYLEEESDGIMTYKLENLFGELESKYGEGGTITDRGSFVPHMIDNVPSGTPVQLEMWDGDVIAGTIDSVEGDMVTISGDTEYEFAKSEIDRSEIVSSDELPDMETDFSQPGSVIQHIEENISPNPSGYTQMKKVGSTMRKMRDEGASPEEAWEVASHVTDKRKHLETISEQLVKDSGLESDILDTDNLDLLSTTRTQSMFNKDAILKSFEDKYPEHEEYLNDLDSAVSAWTGGSKKEETTIFWALAYQDGEDNIPTELANRIDELENRPDIDEYMEAAEAYVEHTRDFLREQFGDEIQLHRGIGGSYGRSRADEAEDEGETIADHRAIASWSWNPYAEDKFSRDKGAAFCQTIDVDDVYMAFSGGAGFTEEFEIVASGGFGEYEHVEDQSEHEPGTIMRGEDMDNENSFKTAWDTISELTDT